MTHDVRILHAADLHGNLTHYRELLSLAVAKQADCVVCLFLFYRQQSPMRKGKKIARSKVSLVFS